MMLDMFKVKMLSITDGTGTFGNPYREIQIFTRDEKRQDDMRKSMRTLN